jgi:hypothetical protein
VPPSGPLHRADRALDAALRWLTDRLGAPGRRLARWERSSTSPLVRGVVTRPGLVAVLAGLVVVAGAGLHLARFPAADGARAPAAPDEIGPPAGTDLTAYAERRHELLLALGEEETGQHLRAVVSFAELVPLGDLPLPDGVEVERVQLLLPGELEPRELGAEGADRDLERALADGREELDLEITELERLLAEDVDDPEFEAEFERELARLTELRDRASADAAVVFAAVVVAPGTVLVDLVDAPGVRLVDPAGSEELTRATRLVGVPPRATEAGAPLEDEPAAHGDGAHAAPA